MSTGHSAKETSPTCIITMVHGTWPSGIIRGIFPKLFPSASPLWFDEGSVFRSRLESELRKENIVATFRQFRWSGANSVFHRARAADELSSLLASDPDNGNSIVIAHSHGGNVAFRAISKLGSRAARIHLITLATPFLQVFPTWSGPSFWTLFIFIETAILLLLDFLFPFTTDRTAAAAAALAASIAHFVILAVFASIASALLVYVIINPSPPEAKRQLALQTKAWASRPFTIAEKTNYDSAGPHAPHLLVIRGVDDEAGLALAFGAIATRINRLTLGALRKVVVVLILALAVLGVLVLVLISVDFGVLSGLDPESALRGWLDNPIDKALETLATLSEKVRALYFLVLLGIAILLAVPALFNGRFGREFLIGATRCEVATDSAPDSARSRIITLQTPDYQPFALKYENWKEVLSMGSMHHFIYNYPDCVPGIVKWINEHVR